MIPSPFEVRQMLGNLLSGLPDRLKSGYQVERIPYTPQADPTPLDDLVGAGVGAWNTGADASQFVRNAPGTVLGGLAGLPGLATDYLTTPRSQRQAQAPPPSFTDVVGGASTNPAGMGVLSGASTTAGQPVASTSSPVRAIRMPDGKMLFTNRPEYGGEEFGTAQAGQMVRAQQAQTPPAAAPTPAEGGGFFGGKSYNWPSPTEATMRGLVAASARAQAGEPPPSQTLAARGKMVPGTTPNLTGGTFSQIEGTPQQQLALQLEQAAGVAALAQLGQQAQVAKLSPMEAAALGSPQAVAMMVGMQMMGPQIQQKQQVTQARIQALGTPGAPGYIADEKQRAIAADEISRTSQQELAYMLSLAGLRPPSGI